MLTVEQARGQIAKSAINIEGYETIALQQAYKRILACDCVAQVNVPPADNSAMDGYAVHAPLTATELNISQTIAAGTAPSALEENTAARILTGANIPKNANAVVMQENCTVTDNGLQINSDVKVGDNIRPKGQDIKSGSTIIAQGTLLNAAALGVLASCGIEKVSVMQRPTVALVNTGSELVAPGKPLAAGQIYNSNQFLLTALLQEWGCDVVSNTHIPDNLEHTKQTLKELSEKVDFIITSGGVSVGDEDHIKPAVESLGELNLWKICLKPGKPLAFGKINGDNKVTPIMGLPGNPVSAFVTTVLFAKPFIEGLYGRKYKPLQPIYAPANFTIDKPRKRPEYIRVQMKESGLTPLTNQSSGVLSAVQKADALALIPQSLTINHGDTVAYYPMLALTHIF